MRQMYVPVQPNAGINPMFDNSELSGDPRIAFERKN